MSNYGNGSTSDIDIYKPIAIVTAMPKLFEVCLFKILDLYLLTSDSQFDFK